MYTRLQLWQYEVASEGMRGKNVNLWFLQNI